MLDYIISSLFQKFFLVYEKTENGGDIMFHIAGHPCIFPYIEYVESLSEVKNLLTEKSRYITLLSKKRE